MKIFIASAKALVALAFGTANLAYAGEGHSKGLVNIVRTHDGTGVSGPGWAAPRFWFTLKGVSAAGACKEWNGSILFVANDKQTLALILAAQTSGLEVAVYWNDTMLTNGWCTAQYVTIGSVVPAY